MKDSSTNIATATVQKRAAPFFQRSAEDAKEDSNFFSQVQTKLTVGAKDDPYEKEADAMADKVTSQTATPDVQTKPADADKGIQSKACEPCTPSPLNIQPRFESSEMEDQLQKKEEDSFSDIPNKNHVAAAGNVNGTVQRWAREVDEGDKIFREAEPNTAGMSKRDAVIAVAKTMLGKIKAKQPGTGGERVGASELWEIFKLAAPGVWTEEQIKTFGQPFPHWCGIFTVWAHKKAGIDLGNWQMGKGVSAFGTLKETSDPQPGDIGYIDQPFQHHALITKVGANIESIDGNSGLFSEVVENTRPKSAYTTFYTGHNSSASTSTPKASATPTAQIPEEDVQTKSDGSGTAPSNVESGIASTKGKGDKLSPTIQSEMQSGLSGDFSNVKIHTDSQAAQMSKQLHAQAFTHGSDIYFSENKFNPGTSSGKHLLAHELTHTLQQGAAPAVQKKTSRTSPLIQRAIVPPTDDDKTKFAEFEKDKKKEQEIIGLGIIRINGSSFEIQLNKFPLKQYANLIREGDKDGNPLPTDPIVAPKPGTRKTEQGKIWRENIRDNVIKAIEKNIPLPENYKTEPKLVLSLLSPSRKNEKGEDTRKQDNRTTVIGNWEMILNECIVPFWDLGGFPQIHEIEHKVDWQILGDKADTLPNLMLLDKSSNAYLGKKVNKSIVWRIEQILKFYRETLGITSLTSDTKEARENYVIKFMSFKTSQTNTRSILVANTMGPEAVNTPFRKDLISIKKGDLPDKHFYFRTKEGGTAYILPDDFINEESFVKISGKRDEKDGYMIDKVMVKKIIRDEKGVATGEIKDMEINVIRDGKDDYHLNQKGYAYSIKNKIKLAALSPVELNDDAEFDPYTGVSATGKVKTDVSFLQGADIDFGIKGSNYFISCNISTSFLKDNKKVPKPFSIDYGSVYIEANSGDGLSIEGEVGFGIEKMGKGSVKVGVDKKGFNASGKFNFDKKLFDGHLEFTYEEKKWTIGGSATMDGKKFKGLKSAKVDFNYSEEKQNLHVGGEAELKVPGISKVKINTDIGNDGEFQVTAEVVLDKIPRIKSGKVTVTIGKTKAKEGQPASDSEWDLGIDGKVDPDFDYAGLSDVSVTFGYAKGAYDISISAKYKKGKFHADKIEAGVTNKPVSKDGKKQDGEPTKDMTFYGGFDMGVDIYDGIGGSITCVLLPDGDVTLDGLVEVKEDKEMFSMKPWEKELLKVDKDIPIASCVVVTLNLYIGGQIKLYADLKPLMIKKGSNLKIGHLSLKKFDDPVITSEIILGSSLVAGAKVSLAVGLSASLLGVIKARIAGVADVNFVALDAAVTGILKMGWSKGTGVEINEASISLEMASKLIVSFGVKAEVLVDLWLTTITLWDHEWPVAAETFPIDIFGEGKKTWKLPLESGGKVGEPKMEDNLKEVQNKATPEEVQSRADDKSKGVARPKVDKQAQAQQVTQDEVLARFRDPHRFDFNSSEDYMVTRYGMYDYLKDHSGMDPKIDFGFIDDAIKKAEFEEYDKFTTYIMGETGFTDDQKAVVIEDFIVNHPTLGDTEISNLRSLIPVKAPPSQKPSSKERGKTQPKITPDIPSPVKPAPPGTVQKKAKAGGASRRTASSSGKTTAKGKQALKNKLQHNQHETEEVNEFMDVDDGLVTPEWEMPAVAEGSAALSAMNDFTGSEQDGEYFKPFYMRPYTRTRKPLQQRAEEKSRSPFFNGPEKKEKTGTAFFQTKLNVGEANDPMEKEADKVADAVTGKGTKKEDRKEDIAKGAGVGKPEQEANKGKTPGADKPALEDKKEKDKTAVQKKEKQEEKEEENKTVVSKKDNAAVATPAAPKGGRTIESAIGEKNGHGASMPANTLSEMQSAFDKDFGDVRIHTDNDAATLSDELDAQAFTTGKDIYFNSGKFDPESDSGKHLLAHELTHVVQQNQDTIRRDPKSEKEEKNRAQKVRDDYQKALKAKNVNWETVAFHFNAFNEPEQRQKMGQLSGSQLFQLHQGAIWAAGVGPYSAAATMTTPVPDMPSAVAAAIETKMIHWQYQEAIDLIIEDLDKRGVINRSLLVGGTMQYLNKANLRGEGQVSAPGFDPKTGKAKPSSGNIGTDAFSVSAGLPLLYSTVIHEFQHVEQMQKPGDSKAEIPDQGNDAQVHVQQEVEAYATELIRAKESGMYNIPDQIEDTWIRLHNKWQDLTDDQSKRKVNDLYKKAHEVAQQALGKSLHLAFTPLKP